MSTRGRERFTKFDELVERHIELRECEPEWYDILWVEEVIGKAATQRIRQDELEAGEWLFVSYNASRRNIPIFVKTLNNEDTLTETLQ